MDQGASESDLVSPGAQARRRGVPYVVLLGSFLLSVVAAVYVGETARSENELRFHASVQNAVREVNDGINSRMLQYIALVRGAAGLLAVNPDVRRGQFAQYVDRLELPRKYPGIPGIGLVRCTAAAQLPALQRQLTQEQDRPVSVWPPGARESYAPICMVEPASAGTRPAVGFDMYTDPIRKAAMDRACDEAAPIATAKVMLIAEPDPAKRSGFLIFVPVYRDGGMPPTVEQRRAELLGFVYAPFRCDDLLGGIVDTAPSTKLAWEVYDDHFLTPDHLLHRSGPPPRDARLSTGDDPDLKPHTLYIAGRLWTLAFEASPDFGPSTIWESGASVFAAGVILSLVLFWVTRSEVRARTAVERSAAALLLSRRELRESQSRLRTLVDSSIIGVTIAELGGKVREGNDAFLKMIGYTPQDMAEGRLDWRTISPPQWAAADEAAIAELRASGRAMAFEKEYIRKDGSRVPILIGAASLGGDLAVAFVLDITDRKEAERERARLLEAEKEARALAENANRTKDEFLATLSHELRTPLNAILGWAQLLQMDGMEEEESRHALAIIERNARVQAQLVEDLLDLSRIITGKIKIDLREVDLPAVIDAAVDAVRPTAEAKGIQLIPVLDAHASPVMGDAHRLQQVAWNLLSNAIKFTPRGGTVEVFLNCVDAHVELVVSDTGIGIAADFLPYVFDRLRQADSTNTRQHGGLGLGLAIVRHLVELHGGSVRAQSAGKDKGSTFTVTLPLAVDRSPRAGGRPASAGDGRRKPLSGIRVVVVDDEADSRELIGAILQRAGATVNVVSSAAEGLALIPQVLPDVLVSDISMPGEDGCSLLRKIRGLSRSQGGDVPAVALTALARQEDRAAALGAGFQLHLSKPVEPQALTDAVASVIARAMQL